MGYRLVKGEVIRPRHFTGLLRQARERGHETLISELVLRSQAQACYAPDNIGHFGLALRRYCHFTSPIRRYADLLVHRSLIGALKLGADGLGPEEAGRFAEMGEHISTTERRATAAERDAMDRYTVAFLEDRVGAVFPGRIVGVTRFGLFVRLHDTAADGLVPLRSLTDDYYIHDEPHHCLVGRRHRRRFILGDALTVRLVEAAPVTGGLLFELAEGAAGEGPSARFVPRGTEKGARRPSDKTLKNREKRGSRKGRARPRRRG